MARINVEESIWSNSKFLRLCIALGDEQKAIGMMVIAWRTAQRFWCPNKKPIPDSEWSDAGLYFDLIDHGLAKRVDGGIYVNGTEDNFDWWFKASDKGKKSAKARMAKFGTSQPINTEPCSNRVRTAPEPLPNQSEALPLPPSLALTTKNKEFLTGEKKQKSSHNKKRSAFANNTSLSDIEEPNTSLTADPPAAYPGREFVKIYVEAFKKKYGENTRPSLDGKVLGLIKTLLKTTPLDRAKNLIAVYFQMDDKWFETKNHDFVTFMSNLDKIGVALDTGLRSGGIDWSKVFEEKEKI